MQRQQAVILADLLKALRRRQRMSQPALAQVSGVSRTTIANIEGSRDPMTGQPPSPQPETLRALARGLGTDGDDVQHPECAAKFYALLMDAAGYLPESAFDMAAYLAPHIPRDDIPAMVARHANEPPESQKFAADGYIRQAHRAQTKRGRGNSRPA